MEVFHQTNLMNKNTSVFQKFDQTKMFQILMGTLSNLFDSTNLITLIWPCITGDLSIVDWFNWLSYFISLKDWYLIFQDVKSFVKTCISVNFFSFLCHHLLLFFKKQCFNWFSVIPKFAFPTMVFTRCYILNSSLF